MNLRFEAKSDEEARFIIDGLKLLGYDDYLSVPKNPAYGFFMVCPFIYCDWHSADDKCIDVGSCHDAFDTSNHRLTTASELEELLDAYKLHPKNTF